MRAVTLHVMDLKSVYLKNKIWMKLLPTCGNTNYVDIVKFEVYFPCLNALYLANVEYGPLLIILAYPSAILPIILKFKPTF